MFLKKKEINLHPFQLEVKTLWRVYLNETCNHGMVKITVTLIVYFLFSINLTPLFRFSYTHTLAYNNNSHDFSASKIKLLIHQDIWTAGKHLQQ